MASTKGHIRRVRQAMLGSITEHYRSHGVEFIDDVPLIVPITGACENVSTLYRLAGHRGLYLTQTGQLSLEIELLEHDAVCCVVPSFRSDPPDQRHLNEFHLIEEEFSYPASIDRAGTRYDPHHAFGVLLERITVAVVSATRGCPNRVGQSRCARRGARTDLA